MGVPGYQSWLSGKHTAAGWVDIMLTHLPHLIAWLCIDMASVIHEENGRVRGYPDRNDSPEVLANKKVIREINTRRTDAEIELEVFVAITQKLSALIAASNPRQGIFFAMDGVAPQAKIQQQRMRRYRATIGEPGLSSVARPEMWKHELPAKSAYDSFDTNAITPGTDFMFRLDRHLRNWIDANRLNLPSHVIYSSHLVPGEGEHKMMDYIRRGVISPSSSEGDVVIHAKDADLIFLMMMARVSNLTLWREKVGGGGKTYIINIDALKLRISALMSPEIPTSENSKSVDYGKIDDYVVLMIFLGNDFLPQHPALANFGRYYRGDTLGASKAVNAIDVLVDIYRRNNDINRDAYGNTVQSELFLTDNGIVLWNNFYQYMINLVQKETELLEVEAKTKFNYTSRPYAESITFHKRVTTSFNPVLNLDKSRRGKSMSTDYGGSAVEDKVFSYARFTQEWYSLALAPLASSADPSLLSLSELVMGTEKSKAYWNPSLDINPNVIRDLGLSGPPSVEAMAQAYMTGISWVYGYYQHGAKGINMDWCYTYYYAPLFADIHRILGEMYDPDEPSMKRLDVSEQPVVLNSWKAFPGQKPLTPYVQLLSVLPPESRGLIPHRLTPLTGMWSPIIDYFVSDYAIRLDGKNNFGDGIPIIPFVDPKRIRGAMAMITLDPDFNEKYATAEDYIPPRLTPDQERIRQGNMNVRTAGVCTTSSIGYKSARNQQDRAGQQYRQAARVDRREQAAYGDRRGGRGGGRGGGSRGGGRGGGRGGSYRASSRPSFTTTTTPAFTSTFTPPVAPAPSFSSLIPTSTTSFTPAATFTPTAAPAPALPPAPFPSSVVPVPGVPAPIPIQQVTFASQPYVPPTTGFAPTTSATYRRGGRAGRGGRFGPPTAGARQFTPTPSQTTQTGQQGLNLPGQQGLNLPGQQGLNLPGQQGLNLPGQQGLNLPAAKASMVPGGGDAGLSFKF
jgi:uncharacterized membrane protein YgcG